MIISQILNEEMVLALAKIWDSRLFSCGFHPASTCTIPGLPPSTNALYETKNRTIRVKGQLKRLPQKMITEAVANYRAMVLALVQMTGIPKIEFPKPIYLVALFYGNWLTVDRETKAVRINSRAGDLDNFQKSLWDALMHAGVFKDEQIVNANIFKVQHPEERTHVILYTP